MPLPVPRLSHALLMLRGTVALMFLAHAVVRVVNGSIAQFGAFMEAHGFAQGLVWVLLITAYEIGGGLLLALGLCVTWVCAGLAFIVLMGIVIIHVHLGWFVGEHGVGGMEYSVLLLASLLVVAAADRAERPAAPA